MTGNIVSESTLDAVDAASLGLAGAATNGTTTEQPTRRQKVAALALSVSGFLMFYLLSAGPVAGIHNVLKIRAFQRAVEVIYAPVVLLVKSHIEPFSSIMKWYVDLFR
ncbi:MAG: hypothetical protein HQ518_09170 [Rhodopirellula sp.]|nr:hypothetical protein [Rhodopirellula sp.]